MNLLVPTFTLRILLEKESPCLPYYIYRTLNLFYRPPSPQNTKLHKSFWLDKLHLMNFGDLVFLWQFPNQKK